MSGLSSHSYAMLLFEWFRWKRSKLSWKTLKYIQRMAVKDRKNYGAGCNSFLESLCALLAIGKSSSKKNRFFARGSIIVNCTCSDRKNLCGAIWYHRLKILYMDHRTFWLALALVRVFISPLPLAHPLVIITPLRFPCPRKLYNLAWSHNKFEAGVIVETNKIQI